MMARKVQHVLLRNATVNKNDEFYTQLVDIERELKHYSGHFENKTVLCNCDDYRISNFFKYFLSNFDKLKLSRLISTCYKERSIDLFAPPVYEKAVSAEFGGHADPANGGLQVKELRGDGDFRSNECIEILKQADIVVTNPPFSLFREYLAQLVKYDKKFLIISNINAITYKEVFQLIRENKIWLGVNFGRGISGFIVPEEYELYGTEARIDESGNRIVSTNNCLWLTNLDHTQRHEYIPLSREYRGHEADFDSYDNFDGINVDNTKDIPKDYNGAIGVPITFLHRFNPEQFEIIKFRKGNDDKDLSINGRCPYFRILIRRKLHSTRESSLTKRQHPVEAADGGMRSAVPQ